MVQAAVIFSIINHDVSHAEDFAICFQDLGGNFYLICVM